MKKIIACVMVGVLLGACGKASVEVKEGVVVEYGGELKAETLTDEQVALKEVKGFDSKKIGEQQVTAVFVNEKDKEIETEIQLEVKDTKKPLIKLKKEKLEITAGDKFDAASNIESVKDPVDGDLKKSEDKKMTKNGYIITSDVNAKKAGSYTVKITAYDVNGNKAESSYKVTVKKKPQEQTQTQNNNQSSGNGYTSNQGSYNKPATGNTGSNKKPTQSKPQQTCKAGELPANALGNSGKMFNSEQEAIDYGNMMSEKDSSIVSFGYTQISDKCDNLINKWTVDFNYGNEFCDNYGWGC